MLECISHGVQKLIIFGDSELVVKGIKEIYKIKNPNVVEKNFFAKELVKHFKVFEIEHVYRNYNEKADALANEGLKVYNVQKFK